MVISRTGDPWSPHVEQLADETVPEGAAVDGEGISPVVQPEENEGDPQPAVGADTPAPAVPDASETPEPTTSPDDTPDELAAALAELEAARSK